MNSSYWELESGAKAESSKVTIVIQEVDRNIMYMSETIPEQQIVRTGIFKTTSQAWSCQVKLGTCPVKDGTCQVNVGTC